MNFDEPITDKARQRIERFLDSHDGLSPSDEAPEQHPRTTRVPDRYAK